VSTCQEVLLVVIRALKILHWRLWGRKMGDFFYGVFSLWYTGGERRREPSLVKDPEPHGEHMYRFGIHLAALLVAFMTFTGCIRSDTPPDLRDGSEVSADAGPDLGDEPDADEPDLGEDPDAELDVEPDVEPDVESDPVCGNGVLEAGEECDMRVGELCDPAYGASCEFCGLSCQLETVRGNVCGDGVLGGPEQCEAGPGCTQCTCDDGYLELGGGCVDADECVDDPCGANATCTNTVGSFECACDPGYTGDGQTCRDVPECSGNPCGPGQSCREENGGYACDDVNECLQPGACVEGALCANKDATGPLGVRFVCYDRDECVFGEDTCQSGTVCENRDATQAQGRYVCLDVDECLNDPCGANATCLNSFGSFTCTCDGGYVGDGQTCRPFGVCGDGILEGSEQCDNGVANASGCAAPYNGSCTVCAQDCSGFVSEQGGTCGDGIVQGSEQCDEGAANVASAPQCEDWEDCPAVCLTQCQQVAARPRLCEQFVGDVTLLTVRDSSDWSSPTGEAVWVEGDFTCHSSFAPLVDITSYCSVSGDVHIRTGNSFTETFIDYQGYPVTCEQTRFDLDYIHPTALPLTHIGGSLHFRGSGRNAQTTIRALTGFENLERVEGGVFFPSLNTTVLPPNVPDASALSSVRVVGGLVLGLADFTWCNNGTCAFDALERINGSAVLASRMGTDDFSSLNNLTTITGSLHLRLQRIVGGYGIRGELGGFDSLTSVSGEVFVEQTGFTVVTGLGALSQVGAGFRFFNNVYMPVSTVLDLCSRDPSAACLY